MVTAARLALPITVSKKAWFTLPVRWWRAGSTRGPARSLGRAPRDGGGPVAVVLQADALRQCPGPADRRRRAAEVVTVNELLIPTEKVAEAALVMAGPWPATMDSVWVALGSPRSPP